MEEINQSISQSNELIINEETPQQESLSKPAFESIPVIESEISSLYTAVGMRDVSDLALIELRGRDSLDFLHRISTNSVKNLLKGEIVKTIFTTEKGRLIDLAVVLNLDDYQLLICSKKHHEKMLIWLNKYVISDDVKVTNIEGKYMLLEVLGPQADSFMTLINGSIVNNIAPNTIKIMNTEGIIFFLAKHLDHNGHLIYWIIADPMYAQKLILYMVDNKGPFEFNLIGEEAYSQYRIEQGIPLAPDEVCDLHNPHELAIMNHVDTAKGCYIGQEVIARLETYNKVQKQLARFIFNDALDQNESYKIFNSGVEIGSITSTTFSLHLNKHVGLGFINHKLYNPGVPLVAKNAKGHTVEVVNIKSVGQDENLHKNR